MLNIAPDVSKDSSLDPIFNKNPKFTLFGWVYYSVKTLIPFYRVVISWVLSPTLIIFSVWFYSGSAGLVWQT